MHAFPFVGAGDATYFEWAEVHVRFVKAPSAAQKSAIRRGVPKPIDDVAFSGRDLHAGSDQFAHVHIAETYGKRAATIPDDDDDDDDGDGRFFFAKSSEVDAFNADIERWLLEVHAICPIFVALRREDGESGGTKLSRWHKESVAQLPRILAGFADVLASDDEDASGAFMARGLLAYDKKITPAWRNWLDPTRDLVAALQKGDGKAFARALGKKPSKNAVEAVTRTLLGNAFRLATVMKAVHAGFDALLPSAKRDPHGLAASLLVAAVHAKHAKHAAALRNIANPDQVAFLGHGLAVSNDKKKRALAVELFEIAISGKKAALTTYNNALYVAMSDNNGLPVDEKRARRFLARCLPFAKKNASIFYNAACVLAEIGDVDAAIENVALAIKHGYTNLRQMKTERVFKSRVAKDPRFVALFAKTTPKKARPQRG